MTNARKYAFDTEFSADGAILRQGPARLTPEALEAERKAAYERGVQDAVAQAERDSAAALDALAKSAKSILDQLVGESRAMRAEAAQVALAAARKIAGAALDAYGVEGAVAAVETAMDALRSQPRLIIRLAPHMADQLKPRLASMCEAHGYGGAVLVRADDTLSVGAVAIDWSDGVATIDPKDISARIDAMVEAALALPPEHS